MAQFKGIVSRRFTARYGGSFGLQGQQGLYFNTSGELPEWLNEGASVEFEGTIGQNGKSVKVHGEVKQIAQQRQTPPETGTGGGQRTGGGVDWDLKDRKIQYQAARNSAIEMVKMLASAGALYDPAKPPARTKLAGIFEDAVDRFTALYFEDVSTFGALERSTPPEERQEQKAQSEQLPE